MMIGNDRTVVSLSRPWALGDFPASCGKERTQTGDTIPRSGTPRPTTKSNLVGTTRELRRRLTPN